MRTAFSPNEGQRAAILWRGGHALVLAGAGTGKTFTIIERTKGLLAEGVGPHRIALLTFTRRAAQEIRTRIGSNITGLFAGTFHAWAIYLMRSRPDLQLQPEAWTVIDRDDQLQIMRRIKVQHVAKGDGQLFPTPAQMLNYVGYARSTLVPVATYLERYTQLGPRQVQFLTTAEREYKAFCESRRYLDFDGMLEALANALHESPTAAQEIGQQYHELLIDEGQDLNPLQWRILDALVPHTRLFMVGDDAQSIYGFRGADFESIHSFTKRVPSRTVLKLEQNYRSGQAILDLANALLAASDLHYNKQLHGTRGIGKMPELHLFPSPSHEANWIASTIVDKYNSGDLFATNKILVRSMSIGRAIEGALVEHEIPYVVIGGSSLFALAHTRDLVAAVRVTLNVRDDLSWMRYLQLFRGIGEVTAERVIAELLTCNSVAEARKVIETMLQQRALDVLAPIRALGRNAATPGKALQLAIAELSKVLQHVYPADWDRRAPDMELMVQLAERRTDLADFLETYTLDPIHGTLASRPEGDVVTLITVHSAKGLEGKRVFIPQARYGVYPHVHSIGDKDAEEEERRVLYVAITRAQDELLFSTAHAGGYTGYQTAGVAEPLVESLPPNLLERVGQGGETLFARPTTADLDDWG